MRTCVGCRRRDEQSRLLRVVIVSDENARKRVVVAQPDPTGCMPGRGAYVHRDLTCGQAAVQRRAFGRALRTSGELKVDAVIDWIACNQTSAPR